MIVSFQIGNERLSQIWTLDHINENENGAVEDFRRDVSLLWEVMVTFTVSQTHNIILRVQNIC